MLGKVGWAVWVVLKTRWCDGQLLPWGWGVWAPRPPLLSPVCPTQFATSQLRLTCEGRDWDNVDMGPWETFPDCFLLASCCLGFSAHLHLALILRGLSGVRINPSRWPPSRLRHLRDVPSLPRAVPSHQPLDLDKGQ